MPLEPGSLYDGNNVMQELSGATLTANLLTGLGVDAIFARTDAGGARTLIADVQGSTVGVLDAAANLQTQYAYEPFGKSSTSGAAGSNASQYTGQGMIGRGSSTTAPAIIIH